MRPPLKLVSHLNISPAHLVFEDASRTISAGFLISRLAMKVQCRRCQASSPLDKCDRQANSIGPNGIGPFSLRLTILPAPRPCLGQISEGAPGPVCSLSTRRPLASDVSWLRCEGTRQLSKRALPAGSIVIQRCAAHLSVLKIHITESICEGASGFVSQRQGEFSHGEETPC